MMINWWLKNLIAQYKIKELLKVGSKLFLKIKYILFWVASKHEAAPFFIK